MHKKDTIVDHQNVLKEILWKNVRPGMFVWDPHPGRVLSIQVENVYLPTENRIRLTTRVKTIGQGVVVLHGMEMPSNYKTLILYPRRSPRVRRMDVAPRHHVR